MIANRCQFKDIAKAYSGILFLEHPLLGGLFIALTFWSPQTGAAGLLAAFTSMLICVFLKLPHISSKAHILNSTLAGLSLGALFHLNGQFWAFVIVGGILTTFLSILISDMMWRRSHLPALCLSFVVSAAILSLVVRRYVPMVDFTGVEFGGVGLGVPASVWIHPWVDLFFSTLSATLFSPNPVLGLLIFLAIVIQSRYIGFLAITGFLFGLLLLNMLSGTHAPGFYVWTCFNFSLTAIAVGGIYTVPDRSSFVYAMFGVAASVLFVIAMQDLMLVYHLPVMALPFVVSTLMCIAVLQRRSSMKSPWLCATPSLPESDYEQRRLTRSRCGEPNSIPLLLPFYGTWNVYQGFDGRHTHKAPWNHAVDFYITEKGQSYRSQGFLLKDYFCYGLPISSPVYGEIVAVVNSVPDNNPGAVNVDNNWGNYILIRLNTGHCVMLAHLKFLSVKVNVGEYVTPKTELAACGNSGRSPQPHLHIHLQKEVALGCPTQLFHFCSVLENSGNQIVNKGTHYKLISRPEEHMSIQAADHARGLSNIHQHLPIGRYFTYKIIDPETNTNKVCRLLVEVTLMGQFRLVSDSGASVAFEEANGVLAFYDQQGPADKLLDMLLLSYGLTPLSELAQQWQDSPAVKLLPLHSWEKILLVFRFILGAGLDSQYRRHWDPTKGMWLQHSTHTLKIGPRTLIAEAEIELDRAFVSNDMSLSFNGHIWRAQLLNNGLIKDHGIPGWREQQIEETSPDMSAI
ncbi:MAG: urea transporter [Gammaproteobacteria bacterium]|nr:urea transporter [Gammaproteobacteria bacterium]MCF6260395.1 urea transporter [Gammaproteobacteria bacterium]